MSHTDAWTQRVARDRRPVFKAIVEALADAIRRGELQPGDRLPSHRQIANAVSVDITTVTRAFTIARAQGLVEGAVGRGTFVSAQAFLENPGAIDLTMNLPPPSGALLGELLAESLGEALARNNPARLMAYYPVEGTPGQRAAGAQWISPCVGDVSEARIVVGPGAQSILTAALISLAPPGSRVVVEALTYPGILDLARHLGVILLSCPGDDDGMDPAALERLCVEHQPVAVYLIPTMQNPMASTIPVERRRALAEVVRRRNLTLIEDDPYGRLLMQPPPAVVTWAPEQTLYIATLSKCLSPGLRIAYALCPDEVMAARISEALRSLSVMSAPLMTTVVTRWIRDGAANDLLDAVRAEAVARRAIAARLLPGATAAESASLHVWLPLATKVAEGRLDAAARQAGLTLVSADRFAVGGVTSQAGVRISLGAAETREALADALTTVAGLID